MQKDLDAAKELRKRRIFPPTQRYLGAVAVGRLRLHRRRETTSEFCWGNVKLFSPKFAPKKASIKFDFTDRNWKFKIAINDGHCELEQLSESDEQTADLTIKTETPVWCDIMAKRRDIVSLVESGKMKIYGDKSLFVAMKRIFEF